MKLREMVKNLPDSVVSDLIRCIENGTERSYEHDGFHVGVNLSEQYIRANNFKIIDTHNAWKLCQKQ